jgi:hypothetical protein
MSETERSMLEDEEIGFEPDDDDDEEEDEADED